MAASPLSLVLASGAWVCLLLTHASVARSLAWMLTPPPLIMLILPFYFNILGFYPSCWAGTEMPDLTRHIHMREDGLTETCLGSSLA